MKEFLATPWEGKEETSNSS